MQCKDIMAMIEGTYPRSAALEFDNVGLQVGRSEKEVRRIYLAALDATDAVIEQAVEQEADMLITHHPLIFSPRKHITDEDFIGRRLLKLIRSDISYYAMHTNYDVLGMARIIWKDFGVDRYRSIDCDDEYGDKRRRNRKSGASSRRDDVGRMLCLCKA